MREFSNIGKIFSILRGINIHPTYLLIPIGLSIVAAAFEGASLGLLIPMLNGFLSKDFSFIKDVPILGTLLTYLPIHFTTTDRSLFGVLIGIFVIATASKNVFKFFAGVSMSFFSDRSLHHLRKVIFSRYLSFGKLYFDRTNVGHHATLLADFTYGALRPVLMVSKYISAFFSLLMYLLVMSVISWKLTAFSLPLFAVLHLAVQMIIGRLQAISRSTAERGSELGKKTVEILSTIPLVKSYHTQEYEQQRYSAISNEKAKLDFQANTLHHLILPFQETITLLAAVILFSGMLYLMVREQVNTAPSFLVYFYLVLNAAAKFGTLTGFRGTLASASGPLEEVLKVFKEDDKYYVRSGRRVFTGLKEAIEFHDLSFAYPEDRHVLHDLNVRIPKGAMTAIVGPTGAGKTTMISLIMRYYDCKPNELFIDGTDIRDFSIESLLKHIALVSQETLLLHDTLRHNITYGLETVTDSDLQEAVKRARLWNFVEQLPVGVDTLIGDRGVKLSGGEKQRVSIARALLKGAEILILDEATSSLDSQTERLIQEAIEEVVKDRTSVVIAHRLSTIRHADNIIVIEGGRVAEQGTLEELLARQNMFYMMWEEQKFV